MILHIDMDAFYASVEQLDNPELTGKCVIIGGSTNRGVVSSASYAARKFGVRSAMPIVTARKRCPEGIFIRPRIDRYKEVSREIMQILTTVFPGRGTRFPLTRRIWTAKVATGCTAVRHRWRSRSNRRSGKKPA